MRKLNYRFCLLLVLGLLLTGGAVFGLHRYQYGRIGEALLWQARRAEEAGRLDQAARYLSMYLELRPLDVETQAHLGEILADTKLAISARSRTRALFVLEQVLLKDPGRAASRQRVINLAMDLGRFDVAKSHLEVLLKETPEDGGLQQKLGECHAGLGKPDLAAACYRTAIRLAPNQLESYTALADLLRNQHTQNPRPELVREADQVMRELVRQNPQAPLAYLARWRYHRKFTPLDRPENLQAAAADVDKALELAPDNLEVLLNAADLAQTRDDSTGALVYLRRARELFPRDVRAVTTLAILQFQADQQTEALDGLRHASQTITGRGQVEILWTLGNLLIDQGKVDEVPAVLTQLRKVTSYPATIEYLQARLLLHENRWAEAAQAFERVRPLVENTAELTMRIDLNLGFCYDQLDDATRQVAAFGRVIARDPTSVPARLGMADALAALGGLDEALDQYRHASALPRTPPSVWREIARLLILQNLRTGKPDWKAVDEALGRARQALPDAADIVLLTADAWVAQDKPEQARAVLTEARDRNPKETQFYTALANLAHQQKDADEVRKLLDEAEKQAGDTVALRLARARLQADRQKSLAALAERIDSFKVEDQARLLQGLAEECYRTGQVAEARRLWTRLAANPRHDHDLRLRLLLFSLALDADDEPAMKHLQAEFKQIEGSTGPMWRYSEARRLIRAARAGNGQSLDEARALLDAASSQRPSWPALLLASAQIDELKGNHEQAIAQYRRAIDLGERSPRVLRQLVDLLCKRQRFDEAQQEIQKLQKQAPLADDLKRLAVAVSLRSHDSTRAVQLAQQAVAADSKDFRDYLWLGQVLAATGKNAAEAEAKFRQAIELGGDAPEPWVALVQFLASANRKTEAQQVIDQAAGKLAPEQAPAALARCYEVMGQRTQALDQFQAALKARPGSVPLLRQLAEFHLRGPQPKEAEAPLRTVLDGKASAAADRDWARRHLAVLLANRIDAVSQQEALKLVGFAVDPQGKVFKESNQHDEDIEEQRVRARVLSKHFSLEARLQAQQILESLKKRVTLQADDQFLLARLYEAHSAWPRARDTLRNLTVAGDLNPVHLNYYVHALLRHGDVGEAQRQVERLEQLEKVRQVEVGALGSVELKAQVLLARKQADRGLALLQAFATAGADRPERNLLVAAYLARMQQVEQALDWCGRARAGCPPELFAAGCLDVLRSGKATAEQAARVEEWLQKVAEDHSRSLDLLVCLADLKDLQGKFQDQADLYRRILKQDPRHSLALNNLAWLLAHHSANKQEALDLITRAIAVAGPRPDLLDTRAFIYLEMGQPRQSIQDLTAIAGEKSGATSFFHLARAQFMAGNRSAAVDALKKARGAGLAVSQLHPLDQRIYQKVVEELEQ